MELINGEENRWSFLFMVLLTVLFIGVFEKEHLYILSKKLYTR